MPTEYQLARRNALRSCAYWRAFGDMRQLHQAQVRLQAVRERYYYGAY